MKYKAYAFDLDGTLVDSKIDFAAIRSELNIADDTGILEAIELFPSDKKEAALAVVHRYEKEAAEASEKIEGALEFLADLKSAGHPCAIFTRNSRETALASLKRHNFEVDLLIAREDAPAKPHPEGLHRIAMKFGVMPTELLFVGDYIYDLRAGLNAGVPVALYLPLEADFDTTGSHFHFAHYSELRKLI